MAELKLDIALTAENISVKKFSFIRPLAMGVLALREKAKQLTTIDHEGPIGTYLSRMGYFDFVGISDPHKVSRGNNLKTIEIGPTSDVDIAIERLKKLLRRDPSLKTLELLLVELAYNVEQHAKTEGIILGQVIDNKIELAIVDNGIGIQKSLSQNPEYTGIDERKAVTLAVQKGVTGWR